MKNQIARATPAEITAAPADTSNTSTESLLDGLIAECHAIIRDVVLPSALAAADDADRRRYLSMVMELAKTGAAVGEAVAQLRAGGEARQRITVERVTPYPPLGGRGV